MFVNEAFVSPEIGRLLKEKGFKEAYNAIIYVDDTVCPTQQMALKWLRENKNIFIFVTYQFEEKTYSSGTVNMIDGNMRSYSINHTTYEKAMEEAIKYALKEIVE